MFTKYNETRQYWDRCEENLDGSWIKEEYDSNGSVTSPQGLVEQLANEAFEQHKFNLKSKILKAIDTMRVEISFDNRTIAFDGDEPSQDRMQRAITSLVGDETISWRMYDNSIETITQTELGKALRESGIKMSELWFCQNESEVEAIVGSDSVWLEKYNSEATGAK